jgi:hypothetical protein
MDLLAKRPLHIANSDLVHIRNERLRRLVAYWLERRGSRAVTRRADIDPIEIPSVLPVIWLYDYVLDNGRFRCRLAGEDIRAMYRTNIVGQYLDEFVLARGWPTIEEHYRAALSGPAIGHAIGQVYSAGLDRIGNGERVLLPLSDEDGRHTTMLIGGTVYEALPPSLELGDKRGGMTRTLIPLTE